MTTGTKGKIESKILPKKYFSKFIIQRWKDALSELVSFIYTFNINILCFLRI
jgi:hypothetical protein